MTDEIQFQAWPKISRLANETMVVTEKIDGTNACLVMIPDANEPFGFKYLCQSRNKFITPGKDTDNAGFAKWCYEWIDELWADLGPGRHFGEWWGSGIQRGYGLEKGQKYFSLFNAPRWNQAFSEGHTFKTPALKVVPLIYNGPFGQTTAWDLASQLYRDGSYAAPGYDNPEGVVVHLRDANATYKITDTTPGVKHV